MKPIFVVEGMGLVRRSDAGVKTAGDQNTVATLVEI
jgi:hypothetical protein